MKKGFVKKDLRKKLEEETIRLKEAGSIAETALSLNRVFEDAQAAAEQYLHSVSNEILKALDMGREQNKAGKGISFEEAIKRIGLKIEF